MPARDVIKRGELYQLVRDFSAMQCMLLSVQSVPV